MPTRGILLLTAGLAAGGAHTQSRAPATETVQVYLTNFSPDDYGAFSQNWAVTQGDQVVMYFGNGVGVLEYDGVDWRLLPPPTTNGQGATFVITLPP